MLLLLIKVPKLPEFCLPRLWLEARGQHALLALGAKRGLRLRKSQSPTCTAAGAALEPEAQSGPGGAQPARGSGVFGRAPETRLSVCPAVPPTVLLPRDPSGWAAEGRTRPSFPGEAWWERAASLCLLLGPARALHIYVLSLCLLYLKNKE